MLTDSHSLIYSYLTNPDIPTIVFIHHSYIVVIDTLLYITTVLLLLFWYSPFMPSRHLDEVFTYNHMALMYLRSCYRVKASMVLKRDDHLFIHNRSF